MRLRPIFIALFGLAMAWSVQAQTDAPPDTQPDAQSGQLDPAAARDQFEQALQDQCPQKQLQMLSPRDLTDGLDEYKSGLTADVRARLFKSETDHCSTSDAGASCVNLADIAAAGAIGRMDDLVTSICTTFLRCRDQGQCDYAR